MKAVSSGKLHEDSDEFKSVKAKLGIMDDRTFNTHLNTLRKLNWVGYNAQSGYYFIHSFAFIMAQLEHTGDQAVKCHVQKELKNFDAFTFAAVVGARVKRFEYWVTRKRWKGRFATYKRGVANHNLPSSPGLTKYFGLSADSMGKMLDMSRTRAVELKNMAVRCGYLECKHKFRDFTTLDCPDYAARRLLGYTDPDIMHKLRIFPDRVAGKDVIRIKQQLHDEVIPNLRTKVSSCDRCLYLSGSGSDFLVMWKTGLRYRSYTPKLIR